VAAFFLPSVFAPAKRARRESVTGRNDRRLLDHQYGRAAFGNRAVKKLSDHHWMVPRGGRTSLRCRRSASRASYASSRASSLVANLVGSHADHDPRVQQGAGREDKKICTALAKQIDQGLPEAEKKIWHGHPVWFDDGNPLVGYAVRKGSVQLLFWSGRSFDEPDLLPEGTFKAAQVHYATVDEIKSTLLARWLRKAKRIQWDYKNIVKRRGVLVKLGEW
jgi:hypothetical protein